nr:hypothetical protein [Tanacetum cinerariifolium]
VQEIIVDEANHVVKEMEDDNEFTDSGIRFNLQHLDDDDQIKFIRHVYSDMEDDIEAQDDGTEITLTDSSKDARVQDTDSELKSIPRNEIESVSSFEAIESEDDDHQSMHKEELTKNDEATADNVIDEIVDMTKPQNDDLNSFADKPSQSDPLGHLHKDLLSNFQGCTPRVLLSLAGG